MWGPGPGLLLLGPACPPTPTSLPSVPQLGLCQVNAADCTHWSWQRERIWVGPAGKVAAARVSSDPTLGFGRRGQKTQGLSGGQGFEFGEGFLQPPKRWWKACP